jgi:hypothetical protein
MGTSLDTDDVILIPGIPTFRKSVVPPLSIRLPIVASCSRSKYVLMAIFFLFCAFGMLVTMLTFFVDDAENKIPLLQKTVMVLIQLFALYWAPFFLAAAAFAFFDAARDKPILIVDKDGISDNRSGLSIRWIDVLSAKLIMVRSGCWGVSLKVREPALLPRSFRLGYPLLRRRKVDEALIQCNLLSAPAHEIVNSMLTLVHKNGGQLLPAHPIFWSSVPPVVPQR